MCFGGRQRTPAPPPPPPVVEDIKPEAPDLEIETDEEIQKKQKRKSGTKMLQTDLGIQGGSASNVSIPKY